MRSITEVNEKSHLAIAVNLIDGALTQGSTLGGIPKVQNHFCQANAGVALRS
jgi:hypothetical protein